MRPKRSKLGTVVLDAAQWARTKEVASALRATRGNVAATARDLEVARSYLYKVIAQSSELLDVLRRVRKETK